MEWIYFVIIFFYIISALSKAGKKKQEEAQKAAAIKQLNRRVEARPTPQPEPRTSFEHAAEAFTDLPLGDVMRYITEQTKKKEAEVEEDIEEYDHVSSFEPQRFRENEASERAAVPASHFHEAQAMRPSLHDLSSLATAPTISKPQFVFAQRKVRRHLHINRSELQKYVIFSEVLGKPRALRKK